MLIKFFILPLINISKNVYLHLMFRYCKFIFAIDFGVFFVFWMDFKQI